MTHPVSACHEYLITPENSDSQDSFDFPHEKGLLWKAEKDERINYVFGTIHSQDYKVTSFPPPVRLALVKSKLLLMETIPSDEANQAFFDAMYFSENTSLKKWLDEQMQHELIRIATDYGIPADKVLQLKPWAAFSLIGRPKPVRAISQEMNLLNLALQMGPTIESLETMQQIIASLESISIDDQITILEDTICNQSKIIRDAKTLVDLYVARDLLGIHKFNQQPHHDEAVFQRFMQAIVYERNEKVMKRIFTAFEDGNTFVAIGASHLADKNGLLVQLQAAGYQLTPLY